MFNAVVHIINVLPTQVLNGSSTQTILFKTKPDYFVYKAFGCACFSLLCSCNMNTFFMLFYVPFSWIKLSK